MTTDPLSWLDDEWLQWTKLQRDRTCRIRKSTAEPRSFEVQLDGNTLINFGSNDYVGLASDPRLVEAAKSAVESGSGSSPLIVGHHSSQADLERSIASFEGCDAAVLFPSGFAANCGTIPTLVQRGDIIFSDAKNHASIIDGCRLSGARIQVYPHGDTDFLRHMLPQSSGFRRRLIVTDGIFSMDGDIAPLAQLAQLAEEFNCMLMVDEAHGTGVLGEHGRGAAEFLAVEDGVHIRVGTLSKAVGSIGGFVAGRTSLVRWLENRARSFVFSTALPESVCLASKKGLELIQEEPERRQRLLETSTALRQSLRDAGWTIPSHDTPIIPVILGAESAVLDCAKRLQDNGIFVPAIRPPSVPEDECLLRISLSYRHSQEDVNSLIDAMKLEAG